MIEQFIIFNKEGLVLFDKSMSKIQGTPVNDLIEVRIKFTSTNSLRFEVPLIAK